MARKRQRAARTERQSFDLQAAFRQAGEAFNAGQLPRAESLLKKVLRQQPESLVVLNNLGFIQHLQGRTTEAIGCYQRVLDIDPRHAGARFNMAKAFIALDRSSEAQEQLRLLLQHEPTNAEALNELGNLRHAAGYVNEARELYCDVLAREPNHPHALLNLGELSRAQGDFEKAAQTLRRYLDVETGDEQAWLSYGEALLGSGVADEASAAFGRAAELASDEVAFWVRLGEAWLHTRNWRGALHAYQRARRLAPQDPTVSLGLARACLEAGELEAAECSVADASLDSHEPLQRAELLNLLGVVRLARQDVQGAEQAFIETLQAQPNSALARSNFGLALAAQGRRDEAQAAFRQAIELDADFGEAYRNLSHSQHCESLDSELPRSIAAALQRDTSEMSRMHLHFAMGKQSDDCGAHDQAFTHYVRANAIHFRRFPFDLAAFRRHVDRIRWTFGCDYFANRTAPVNTSRLPVFVVGMPRSGTTLIEQVIGSHRQGAGRSELRKIEQLVFRLESDGGVYPESVPELPYTQLQVMARDYLTELQQASGNDCARIVDKMPFNFLHLGLIATLFPNAGIVHCRRDPLDTCLSNYFQYFSAGADYSYDLATLGRYYRAYERLMSHWQETLPRAPLKINYEAFVEDAESQTRILLDYLDLPWDPACLAFHESPRNVLTLSAWQVRRPLYKTAMQRSRHYQAFLAPLCAALEESG
ncbi:MAG: sulfotransferase [Gammaproteobacteria bacterium]|nr:sulfotransferase [Gammaproteobacteria bacterium]